MHLPRGCSRIFPLVACLFLGAAASLLAQATNAPPRDPLMSLMISQPKLQIPALTVATAAFDPPVVRPGEQSFLRVTFNALEDAIEWPTNLVGPPELELRPGAHGQMLKMTGTNFEPHSAFNTRARASSLGSFIVPEFVVRVDGKPVAVPSARLEVVSTPPASVPAVPQLALDLPVTNLFVGQAIRAQVVLPGLAGGIVQGLAYPQLSGQGFLVDVAVARQRVEAVHRGGTNVLSFIYETTLTPLTTGRLTVVAQGFMAGNRFSGPVVIAGQATIPGGPPQYTLLESEPVELNVRPLPREGELPGFTGAIGSFAVGPPQLSTNELRVGEPVRLTVTITNRGDGPLARIAPPPPPKTRDWQVFAAADFAPAQPVSPPPPPASPVSPPPQPAGFQGVLTFNYTLVALTEATTATPPIPFSCYDPRAGAYADLTIPPVSVTVSPGATPGDLGSLLQAGSVEAEPEKELVLSSLAASRGRPAASLVPPQQRAWFPLVQLAPGVAFLGIWAWDRRRRYLEAHPDVVLRRRARRALRRERRILQRAAQAADAPRFAAAAVSAMRVACAPHYPAEPRALVGGDVLPLLPAAERSGRAGEVVRRFFAVTDSALFGPTAANAAELLPLQPELEQVLEQLEARL
ncbi:MAG TPA: hypothetical protein PLU91_01075 [Verrucomicrobiota bacterium]|nr:hypothetical protein [Verrucomicrobiota bacterium]